DERAIPPLRRFRLRRPEERERPRPGRAGARRRVPPGILRGRPLGPHRHGRHRILHLAAPRLPLAARRHGLRRASDLRARAQAHGLNFDLTNEQELVRDTVRDFAQEKVAPVAAELDREKRFPYDLVRDLAGLGLMGMTVPEEYGGAGSDTVSYAIAVEELTRVDS